MEKVLVTGVTGFIGRHVAARLIDMGYEVHSIERYVTGRYTIDSKRIMTHYANLTDYPAIKHIVKSIKPDYCMHIAAITPVAFGYEHFIEVNETNYLSTINLAESCYRDVPHFKQFIFAGTSEEYGMTLTDRNSILTEESELHPNSPYAIAKVASDLYLKYMNEAYGFPCTILRPFNTYGRTDNKHFFIERTITQMLEGKNVYLGSKDAVRDWMYVDDHVDAYIKSIGNERAIGEVIQVCTGKGYTTEETANIIANFVGFEGKVIWNSTQMRPLDAKVLIGDNSKAKKILGWEPHYQLEEGLKIVIDHWRQAKEKSNR